MRAAKRLQLSSQITAPARATLEPSIGASLILPIFWSEEASEISAVQAATFRGGVYRAQRVAATLCTVLYPAAAALAALAGMAALVAERPHRDHDNASGSAIGGGAAASSATDNFLSIMTRPVAGLAAAAAIAAAASAACRARHSNSGIWCQRDFWRVIAPDTLEKGPHALFGRGPSAKRPGGPRPVAVSP
ncbi:hypothetical protein PLESTB_000849100 [Pleodorina starrii]|uniref:Uncharacterized protein n=1 Tax=Pleodorina starrii TaxID=330485 RepID=A0A9W6BLI5_9CHLO|nr:hypothetical protein PLESTM_001444300 [Pleodorina starrii]GLC54304.1 hypothetical protein PLESTB_000849100 [Pleodorina starrii]